VLAPGDLWRDEIVPAKRATASLTVDTPKPASKPKRPHHRYLMAQLMRPASSGWKSFAAPSVAANEPGPYRVSHFPPDSHIQRSEMVKEEESD
jgi:hypothetical protein